MLLPLAKLGILATTNRLRSKKQCKKNLIGLRTRCLTKKNVRAYIIRFETFAGNLPASY